MKKWIGSMIIAFSMYSRIPMPRVEWTKERMEHALCFFPFIGLILGGVCTAFGAAVRTAGLEGTLFYACAGTLIPLAVTGGIHMDGYLDVCDALCSYGTREKRLEIMKDPRTGAFGVIRGGMYLIGFLGVFSLIPADRLGLTAGVFTLSRALSAWAVVSLPKARPDGLAAAFSRDAAAKTVQAFSAAFVILSAALLRMTAGPAVCAACVLTAGIVFLHYRHMALKEFGGVTGDLAGYFLQRAELWQLAAAAAVITAERWLL